jgi:mono/diheme cytochrome c family protein
MGQVSVAIALLLVLFAGPLHAETQLERGRYLVETLAGCGNCHTPRGPNGPLNDKKFAGGEIIKHADFTAVTPNITPDPQTGIGKWTDDQIALAIREGRRPDGRLLGPAMPSRSYRHLADEDVEAIIAYLRSVPPVYNRITAQSHYDALLPASWGPPWGMSTRRQKKTRWPMAPTSPGRSRAAWTATPSRRRLGNRRDWGRAARSSMAPGASRFRPI